MMDEVSLTDCSVNPLNLTCMQIDLRVFHLYPYAVMCTVKDGDKIFDKCTV